MWSQVRIKYFWMCKAFHFFFCTKKTMRMKINRKKWQSSFCLYIDFWKLIFRFIIQIWSPAPVVKGHHAQRGVAGRWGNSSSLIQKGAELPDEAYNWCSPCNVTNCAPTEYKYLLDSLGYLLFLSSLVSSTSHGLGDVYSDIIYSPVCLLSLVLCPRSKEDKPFGIQ